MAASFCRRSLLNYKNCLFNSQKRTSYIILIPETPEELSDSTLKSVTNLPDFSKLNSKTCKLLVTNLAQNYDIGFYEISQYLTNQNVTGTTDFLKYVLDPLEVLSVPFSTSWGYVEALHFSDAENISKKVVNPLFDRVTQVWNSKYNNKLFYDTCKRLLDEEGDNISPEQKRILEKFVWENYFNGVSLSGSDLSDFDRHTRNLYDAKSSYEYKLKTTKYLFKQFITDEKFAEECPLDLVRNTAQNKKNIFKGPWVLSLNNSVVSRFLEYCTSVESRKNLWLSFTQICSTRGDSRLKAVDEFQKIREVRIEMAKLLGYPTYADMVMKTKMAESVDNVKLVLSEILRHAKNSHELELNEVERFAFKNDFKSILYNYDFPYWKRIYLKKKFNIDEMFLVNYFPLSQVLLGLIALCEQLFGITIEEEPGVVGWTLDVVYYNVFDAKTKKLLGGFYFDPYAEENKLIGDSNAGWFVPMRKKSRICNSLPLSAMIFNFTPPDDNKPCLLYLREVEHLFAKFGLMLVHTLTDNNYSEVSGLSNLEHDFVNTTSHLLLFWLYEKGTLESITSHYDTGESLPSHILDNLCNYPKFMAGTKLCKDIYFSHLDLALYSSRRSGLEIASELWPDHMLFHLLHLDKHPFGFEEVILGPFGGSFYSKVWSMMLGADVYLAFEEVGLNKQEEIANIGKRYRSTFLASGGAKSAKEIFKEFRGRDPDPRSLVKLLCLEQSLLADSKAAPILNVNQKLPLPKNEC